MLNKHGGGEGHYCNSSMKKNAMNNQKVVIIKKIIVFLIYFIKHLFTKANCFLISC